MENEEIPFDWFKIYPLELPEAIEIEETIH